MPAEDLKKLVSDTIDKRADELSNLSKKIWDEPELGFKESAAHDLLTSFLEKEGFSVKKKTPLETSFIARCGNSSGLKVGVLCEYDALPEIGHACGHNLIAEAGVAAAISLKAILTSHPDTQLEVIVYGTPAEEGGGGKVLMIKEGVFDETDICMMSHPAPYELPSMIFLAVRQLKIVFEGKASHAAAAPWEGINALDAAVSCYNNVSMLRQQMKPTSRVNVVIVDGGKRPNIIPERSEMAFYVRDLLDEDVIALERKVRDCAHGAALATGCSVFISTPSPFYSAVKVNSVLIKLYIENAKSLGVEFNDDDKVKDFVAATDMGNVSQIKPSIHPCFKIKADGPNHSHVFTKAAGAVENQRPTLCSAKSMAMSVVDIIVKPSLLQDIKESFKNK